MNYKLEVIAFNIESCITIQNCGAHRIELCDNPGDGGTTPSYGFIKAAREKTSIELYPIIRPRGGDFLYSNAEFEIMKTDIASCKKLGCDGVVIGILKADGTIDKKRCGQLIELAYPLEATFHRAFDRVSDAEQALEDVIEIGCERILTSGLQPNAFDGINTIASLIKQAEERIIIMPGSGVRSSNIIEIAQQTMANEFHTSARMLVKSKMDFSNPAMTEDLKSVTADEQELTKTLLALQTLTK
ncbi:MAG: copper homeostasis protein CutC [Ferruginibacter sp.]